MREIITNRVHAHRTKLNLTQEELAERAQVTRQTIIAIERGHYTPSVLLSLKLARIFKVTVEDLFTICHER